MLIFIVLIFVQLLVLYLQTHLAPSISPKRYGVAIAKTWCRGGGGADKLLNQIFPNLLFLVILSSK